MLLLTFLLVCGGSMVLTMTMPKKTYDMEDAEALFEKFIIDYGKQYKHEEETQMRFELFKTTLQLINKKNMGLKEPVHGITQFADYSSEELRQLTGYVPSTKDFKECDGPNFEEIYFKQAPESFDWREKNVLTRVKNQGQCGSCWAFSTTGNVESQYIMKHNQQIELSEQQLVDCVTHSKGCNGGIMHEAIFYLMDNGATTEEEYPYTATNDTCNYNGNSSKVTVTGCKNFVGVDEEQLKEALYKYGPLSIAVDANGWSTYAKGILHCSNGRVDHAVLLVGYGTENGTPFWTIKNSWGTTWGEEGYVRVIRGKNACSMLDAELITAFVA